MYHCAWPTWLPEVTWPKIMWFLRGFPWKCERMCNRFPRIFLIIVIVQNVSMRMTDMATGSDRSVPLEGCVHAQPEVAQYPPYWGLYETSPVGLPLELEVTRSAMPLGCSLGRPRPITLSRMRDRKCPIVNLFNPTQKRIERVQPISSLEIWPMRWHNAVSINQSEVRKKNQSESRIQKETTNRLHR